MKKQLNPGVKKSQTQKRTMETVRMPAGRTQQALDAKTKRKKIKSY